MATSPRARILPLTVVLVAAPTLLAGSGSSRLLATAAAGSVPAEAAELPQHAVPVPTPRGVATPDVVDVRRGGIAARLHTDDGTPVPGDVFALMATRGSALTVRVYDATPFIHGQGLAADTAASNEAAATLVGEVLARRVESIEMTDPPGGGESLGLAYVLAYLNVETDGAFTGPVRVAAAGTLRAHGYVGPIGAIDEKAAAAQVADVDVLFTSSIPTGAETTGSLFRARRPEVSLGEERSWDIYREDGVRAGASTVVGVRHVGDVAAWLCGAGSDDACVLLDRFESLRPVDDGAAAPVVIVDRPARVA